MTVHAIEFFGADPPGQGFETGIQNYLDAHTRALTEQDISVAAGNTEMDGTGTAYMHGLFRFDMSEDQTELMNSLYNRINMMDWVVIRHHTCDHDEDARGGCSWDATNFHPDQATVPDDVEAML